MAVAEKALGEAGRRAKVEAIIAANQGKPGALLPILRGIQREFGYLAEADLLAVAQALGLPMSKVYGTATFYSLFALKPKGKYVIRICESAPCHVEGFPEILEAIKAELGIGLGETTPDWKFSLETTSCIGVCGVAPAIMINDEVYGNLTPEAIPQILAQYK